MFRKKQQPRAPISARTINHGVEAREILDNLTVAAPLEIHRGLGGMAIRLAATIFNFSFGVTVGAIGTGTLASPASGSVTLAKWTGSGFSTSGMPSVTALSVWDAGGTGIGSGKTVFMIRLAGQWIILGWDC